MDSREKRSSLLIKVVIATVCVLSLAVVSFIGLIFWIDSQVREYTIEVQTEFPGDEVEALIALLESEAHSLEEKNRAIWALGRLRDARAVPRWPPPAT